MTVSHSYPDTEPMRRPVAAVLQELSDVIEAVRGDRSIVRVSGLCGNAQDVGVVGIDSLQETIKRACAELTANGAPSVAGRIGKDIAIAICALAAEQSSTPIQSTAQISELDDASNACLELAAKHGYATGHGDTVADMIREFSAQIPIRAPAQGWQDISTAPKDETEIIGVFHRRYDEDGPATVYGPWTVAWDGRKWRSSWDGSEVISSESDFGTEYKGPDIDPTHWQPLPGVSIPSTSRCTCAAIVNPNIPHARTCPLSSQDRA